MRKKFLGALLIGAFLFASTGTFTSCKDYDDDIESLNQKVDNLNQSLSDLQATIGNNGVKNVSYDPATGTLTITDNSDKTYSCTIEQNLPEYTIAVEGNQVVLKKDGTTVSTGNLPADTSFDPSQLTINADGEVLYNGTATKVTVPTSSISVIKQNDTVVGYTFTIDGKDYPFYIADALPLTSLVFIPESYLDGVEAMRATNLKYDKWTQKVSDTPATATGEVWNAPESPASDSNITPDMVAHYYVNPAGVTMEQIKNLVLTADDKDYIASRSTNVKLEVDMEKTTITDGVLNVVFKGNSEAIQKLGTDKITVMNLEATVDANGEEKVVHSDFSAIYKSVMKDFVLAYKGGVSEDQHLYGADNAHSLIGKAEDAITNDETPIVELTYNDKTGVDLSKYIETHYTEWTDAETPEQIGEGEKVLDNDKLADYGLKLSYALSDYTEGNNETKQSSFFANLNGSVITAKVGDVTDNPIAAVGRMPLVRVELQNAANGEVVNVGWIKVKIVRGQIAGDSWTKDFGSFNLQCDEKVNNITFDEMNVNIYQKLGLTKADFHAIYKLKTQNGTEESTDPAILANTTDKGEVTILPDDDPNVETVCLQWDITPQEAQEAIANNDGKISATVTYEPRNDESRGNVTITFNATVVGPSASFDSGSKIAEYWYNNMTGIRINTVTPGTLTDDCAFVSDMDNVFNGNKPTFKHNNSSFNEGDFALDQVTYRYAFDAANEGKEVLGNDGNTYVLHVANETTLQAAIKGIGANENVATIDQTEGTISYADTETAKAILNTYGHNDPNTFSAKINVLLTNSCNMNLPMSDGKFDAAFLRPINVFANEGKSFTDAVDKGSTVNMLDLVYLTDWRDIPFEPDHAEGDNSYYKYYGVTSIAIDEANITCNLNGGDIETQKLSEVTKQIIIEQTDDSATGDYGTVTYTNNTNNVQQFRLKIPVTVTYKWGTVKTAVYMDVKPTQGQNN